jgi:hypothetical protein
MRATLEGDRCLRREHSTLRVTTHTDQRCWGFGSGTNVRPTATRLLESPLGSWRRWRPRGSLGAPRGIPRDDGHDVGRTVREAAAHAGASSSRARVGVRTNDHACGVAGDSCATVHCRCCPGHAQRSVLGRHLQSRWGTRDLRPHTGQLRQVERVLRAHRGAARCRGATHPREGPAANRRGDLARPPPLAPRLRDVDRLHAGVLRGPHGADSRAVESRCSEPSRSARSGGDRGRWRRSVTDHPLLRNGSGVIPSHLRC